MAHDIQQQVSKYISSDLKMINSYDTWHGNAMFGNIICNTQVSSGTKNVKKLLENITKGTKKSRNVTWFPELVDKRKFMLICAQLLMDDHELMCTI